MPKPPKPRPAYTQNPPAPFPHVSPSYLVIQSDDYIFDESDEEPGQLGNR